MLKEGISQFIILSLCFCKRNRFRKEQKLGTGALVNGITVR
jgi:hypothetical protein